ncbi:MAG: type II secretion system F family protein [Gammaproteobacteria bacterium]|nr:type II secretion system F family protein [Gammaproteobacteria bacterium]
MLREQAISAPLSDLLDLVRSGVNLVTALDMVTAALPHPEARQVFYQCALSAKEGGSWTAPLATVLPSTDYYLLSACCEAGKLEQGLALLVEQMAFRQQLRHELRAGLRYPLTLISLSIVAALSLLFNLVPPLLSFANDSGISLGNTGSVLMWLYEHRFALIAAVATVAALIAILALPVVRMRVLARLNLPMQQVGWNYQWLFLMSQLVAAGIPLQQAISQSSSAKSTSHRQAVALRQLNDRLLAGWGVDAAFGQCAFLSVRQRQLIRIAQSTGRLDVAFAQCAHLSFLALERAKGQLISAARGIGLGLGGGMVFLIVGGLILPIYDAVFSQVGQQ